MLARLLAFDIYPKTNDELKERTLGGALISVICTIFAVTLFVSEFSQWRTIETVDKLDVDVTANATGKLPVNVDIYLPSLPCNEIVTDVVDDSGNQRLEVTNDLRKLRVDRNGVPIDIPQAVDWEHAIAPAFQQRKLVSLMEEAHTHMSETLSHLEHEQEENPTLSEEEHKAHQLQLAEQAALLQGRLSILTDAADAPFADDSEEGGTKRAEHMEGTAQELRKMHEHVLESRVYSDEQRSAVLANLHAMERNLDWLQQANNTKSDNMKEALRIRLSILKDNVQGFVSAEDIDRRERYSMVSEMLLDVANASVGLPATVKDHVKATTDEMRQSLDQLNSGLAGSKRRDVESKLDGLLRSLRADLAGEEVLPDNYCGSCYGAATDGRCCNSCDAIRAAYAEKRWGFPANSQFEQCQRESRVKVAQVQEGEGCNVFGTMEVARVTGSFQLAPASKARSLQPLKLFNQGQPEDWARFNVTHHIKRFSFGIDFPGQENPLDGVWTSSPGGAAVSKYFLKVVPTTYEFVHGKSVQTNQYSVTQYFKPLDGVTSSMMPMIAFTFELTPLKVMKTERRSGTLLHFATRIAALIGGLFTVAGILDAALYHSSKQLIKMQLNKAA
jgi:hypothetical protein